MNDDLSSTQTQEKLAGFAVIAVSFLIPIFVIPLSTTPFEFTKVMLALIGVVFLMVMFSLSTLRTRALSLPYSPLTFGLGILPAAYLAASAFSSNPALSFFGYRFEGDTFGFILVASLLATMVFWTVTSYKTVFSALFAILIAGWVALSFQLVQIFFAAPTGLPALASTTANMVGKWNDFGLFAGLVSSLILIALSAITLSRSYTLILYGTLAVALFILALINFPTAWIMLAAVAFLVLVFSLLRAQSKAENGEDTRWKLHAAVAGFVLVVSLGFIMFGSALATPLQNAVGTAGFEVRPSLEGTRVIAEAVYRENPLFGSGPNTFGAEWFLNRSPGILATPFWNVPFGSGSSSVTTAFVTGGLLVGLAWVLFILLFLYTFVRALFLDTKFQRPSSVFAVLAGSGALFLLVAHILYVPSAGLTLTMFLLTGLMLASLHGTPLISVQKISFATDLKLGFTSIVAVILALLAVFALFLFAARLYAASVFYEQAILYSSRGDLEKTEERARRSLLFAENDRTYRALATASISRLSALVASGASDEAARKEFQSALTNAFSSAQSAVRYDPDNFANWMTSGSVYAVAVQLGIDGAYENATPVYEEARKRNPETPEVDFRLAQLEAARGNDDAARRYAEAALLKKADYTPAILFIGQLALNEGNLTEAVRSVESALVFEPRNPLLWYQLGVLNIADVSYEDAARAFKAALDTDPNYANARFFLAQSYAFLGRLDEAIPLIERLIAENPDNTELPRIITDLKQGENPFINNTTPSLEPDSGE